MYMLFIGRACTSGSDSISKFEVDNTGRDWITWSGRWRIPRFSVFLWFLSIFSWKQVCADSAIGKFRLGEVKLFFCRCTLKTPEFYSWCPSWQGWIAKSLARARFQEPWWPLEEISTRQNKFGKVDGRRRCRRFFQGRDECTALGDILIRVRTFACNYTPKNIEWKMKLQHNLVFAWNWLKWSPLSWLDELRIVLAEKGFDGKL